MRLAVASLACIATACAAPATTPAPVTVSPPAKAAPLPLTYAIANASFEEAFPPGRGCPPRWGCSVHADGSSFRFAPDAAGAVEGRQSLLVERVGKEPWATVTQSFKAEPLRGQRVRFSPAVRAQGVEGDGAGPWLLVNGGGEVLDHQVRRVVGTANWQRQVIEIVVPPRAEYLSVGGTLEGGGRAWFDDAKLEILGPAAR